LKFRIVRHLRDIVNLVRNHVVVVLPQWIWVVLPEKNDDCQIFLA